MYLGVSVYMNVHAVDIQDESNDYGLRNRQEYEIYVSTPNYNRTNAISYANRYATTHSPYFTDYGDADCTNYVSQCLLAGGLQTNSVWNIPGTLGVSTVAWATADGLKNYLKDYGLATKRSSWSKDGTPEPYVTWAYVNNSDQLTSNNTGETVIFYDWDGAYGMNHAALFIRNNNATWDTGADGNVTGDLMNQHSPDRDHVIWHGDKRNTMRATTRIYAFEINT